MLSNKKFLFLLILSLAFIISGLLEPVIRKNIVKGWEQDLILRVIDNENRILGLFNDKVNNIVKTAGKLKNDLRSIINGDDASLIFDLITEEKLNQLNIQVNDHDSKILGWNNTLLFNENEIAGNIPGPGQVFFKRKNLSTYVYLIDTLNAGNKTFYFTVGEEIERHYQLTGPAFPDVSFSGTLSKNLSTSITIEYDQNATLSRDGRNHSFFLLNNFNNKIGVVTFEKPTLDLSLRDLDELIKVIQSVLLLLIFIAIGWIGINLIRNLNKRIYKFLLIAFYLSALRIILFILGIPSNYLHNEMTDPSNFSSVFAFGIVRSPLDFFITILLLTIIVLYAFKYSTEYLERKEVGTGNRVKYYFLSLPVIFLLFILLRSIGASIRSVVFDSAIRYFKEFALIPSPGILMMDLNILLLGFCGVLLAVMILKFLFVILSGGNKNLSLFKIILFFIMLQFLGWLFDFFQVQPQGTPFIRILSLTLLFLLAYSSFVKRHKIIHYIYYGFASSVITVSLFVYFNSEIERESLKTTAYEIAGRNEGIYEFILYQTLTLSAADGIPYNVSDNYSSLAFEIWNKSLLFRESIPSAVSLYSSDRILLGQFRNSERIGAAEIESYLDQSGKEPKIFRNKNLFGSQQILTGIVRVNDKTGFNGFLAVSVLFDKYSPRLDILPEFLSVSRTGMASATEFENLKIIFIEDGFVVKTIGDVSLNSGELQKITDPGLTKNNEAWTDLDIKGEAHLLFILKPGETENEIIAVALEQKRFAWNLSNFFKVFFVHSVIILTLFLIYSAGHLKKWKVYLSSYRTKLTFAFIIVSVVPLIAITAYLRNINENKNEELINNKLSEDALKVSSYLNQYLSSSTINAQTIFEKAEADLNVEFNCYHNEKLVYSSGKVFYETGLINPVLNPAAFRNFNFQGSSKIFLKENSNGEKYYSVYTITGSRDNPLIINVSTLMNRMNLPLSDVELDLFLFGILAVALILLISLSTILAGQISSPIRRLTHATRSIGSGDLNIEIKEKSTGEIGELAEGFNMMIRKLKKSQIELAQLERETAWKEMARQVAHEIKNPLTPMKLSVQQLIAAYRDKSPKFDEIFNKVTVTFINQIETLKNIASEFSNFARMPKLNIEKVELVGLIRETLNLFSDEKYPIALNSQIDSIIINADSDHLSRSIINLVRNSIQAGASNVEIRISANSASCEIRVVDNGTGIDPLIIDRIFEENFTTKSQGMGLGLSLTKKFIDSIGGTIEVEKTSAAGTTFLITLPVSE